MYQLNEMDLGRQHREDLLREVAAERLAQRLRATRPNRAARLRNALFGRFLSEAAGGLRAEDSRCA